MDLAISAVVQVHDHQVRRPAWRLKARHQRRVSQFLPRLEFGDGRFRCQLQQRLFTVGRRARRLQSLLVGADELERGQLLCDGDELSIERLDYLVFDVRRTVRRNDGAFVSPVAIDVVVDAVRAVCRRRIDEIAHFVRSRDARSAGRSGLSRPPGAGLHAVEERHAQRARVLADNAQVQQVVRGVTAVLELVMVVRQKGRTVDFAEEANMFPVGADDLALHAELLVVRVRRQEIDPRGMVWIVAGKPFFRVGERCEKPRRRFVVEFVDIERRMVFHAVDHRLHRRRRRRIVDIEKYLSVAERLGLVDGAHSVLGRKVQFLRRHRPHGVETALLQLGKPSIGKPFVSGETGAGPVCRHRLARIPGRAGSSCRANAKDNSP